MRNRPIRLAMAGGGEGSLIGPIHRMAAQLDGHYQLVAGALSSDLERARESGLRLGLPEDRAYADFRAMAEQESSRENGAEAVAVVTPNHLHHPMCMEFLGRGFDVMCDKPLSTSDEQAAELVQRVHESGRLFGVTYNYTGYPMVREAREMIREGELGELRLVMVEYVQDWLSLPLERKGHRQAEWRMDPKRAGKGGAVGDLGSHAHSLVEFVTGRRMEKLSADLHSVVPGRILDDNALIQFQLKGEIRGHMWLSQVAVGSRNGLRLRVYGDRAGLWWSQEDPGRLHFAPLGEHPQELAAGHPSLSHAAARSCRLPPGHPEGYLEAFANLYRDMAEQFWARQLCRKPNPAAMLLPTVEDGARGVRFVHAAVASSRAGRAWIEV
ncbi:MAG: Gfo/Idh/MocA family oxidoreductase [Armatimonadetes bacterium]|nr:Gfo/Idh/MocA family oxidoreductase [Armatimonadota bacterium]